LTSFVSIGFASSLDNLLADIASSNKIVLRARQATHVALVFGPLSGRGFRDEIEQRFTSGLIRAVYHSERGITPRMFAAVARRSSWVDVNIDERAPRLRNVKLPRGLVESQAVIGAADLRRAGAERPVIALGLWASLASPVHRIGALVTGQREGLTAEIGLAVSPAALIAVDRLARSGPLVAMVSDDPIAAELVALAFWRLRHPSSTDLPGPWEDPLIQRATELGLGVTQPSQIAVRATLLADLSDDERRDSRTSLSLAMQSLGIEQGDNQPIVNPMGAEQ